jgi:hypothetical protein
MRVYERFVGFNAEVDELIVEHRRQRCLSSH